MIRRPIRRQRNRRKITQQEPWTPEDTTFEVTDFDNPGGGGDVVVRITTDQPSILRFIPEDIFIESAGDPTQQVSCKAATQVDQYNIDLFFDGAFPDTSVVADSDFLDVPFYTDDVRTYSGGYLDASRRTMEVEEE